MFFSIAALLLGFLLLLKGADWLVEGASSIARRAGVSQLIIGLTLVAFGTSLPEFFVNAASRLQGHSDITLGDLFGSNIANILLVLGLAAVFRPVRFPKSTVRFEIPFALLSAGILWLLLDGPARHGDTRLLSRADGAILLGLFAAFLFYMLRLHRAAPPGESHPHVPQAGRLGGPLMVLLGIPSLALGAKGVVAGATSVASALGIPHALIGLTVVAVGTSLPELATTLTASIKGRSDIAVGNIVGSNIFNICWILGISSLASPLQVPSVYLTDVAIILAATAALLAVVAACGGSLGRRWGAVLTAGYAAYLVSLILRSA